MKRTPSSTNESTTRIRVHNDKSKTQFHSNDIKNIPVAQGNRYVFLVLPTVLIGLLAITLWLSLTANQTDINNLPPPLLPIDSITVGNEPIRPIPLTTNVNPEKAALGQRLFFDPRLSADDSIACVTCHNLDNGGADNLSKPVGFGGLIGEANTLTVFNSANNFVLFWDGRANSLEEQIDGPINNPTEMASSWKQVIGKLKNDPNYVKDFNQLYREGITRHTIKNAIASFERTLITPNSRFDRYLRGEKNAINDQEKQGYQLFKAYGCIACHQGVNVGGNMFQKFGVMADYFSNHRPTNPINLGRFNVTGKIEDRYYFRVPSLRNVALTAPYFHNGSAKTLEQAVHIMAKFQLGRSIPRQDVNAIIDFLKTLTGEYNGHAL